MTTATTTITEPGIYPGLTFDEYAAIDACSNSLLSQMLESPADAKWYMDNTSESSPAQEFGKAAHACTLQPDVFAATYAMEPPLPEGAKNPRATKAYKDAVAELEADGKTVLKADDYAKAQNVAARIHAHPKAGPLIRKEGSQYEVVLVWRDEGYLCKAMVDQLAPGLVNDLKMTRDFNGYSPWVFTKYGTYRQAAWYLRGAKALGLDVRKFFVTVVANGNVQKVKVGYAGKLALEAGDTEVGYLFANYRRCMDADQWPGDVDDIEEFDVTDRKFNELFPD